MVKNLPANAEDLRDKDSISGLGRSPGVGNGNPIQYSCLENPMDRGAWKATVNGVARVGHNLAIKPSPNTHLKRKMTKLLFHRASSSHLPKDLEEKENQGAP